MNVLIPRTSADRIRLTACLAFMAFTAFAGPDLAIQEPWSTVFGDKEFTYHVTVRSPEPFDGTVAWVLTCENRTLARQEHVVHAQPAQDAVQEIRVTLPAVKDRVTMPVTLGVQLLAAGKPAPVAAITRTLTVFAEDAFADRRETLRKAGITVFDPARNTCERLDKEKVPYQAVRSVEALAASKSGMLLIGEGASFREYRGLWPALRAAAARGVPVLCLAPAGGEMPLTDPEADAIPVAGVRFERAALVKSIGKHLDADGWPGDGRMASHSLALRGGHGPVVLAVDEGTTGWAFAELTFGPRRTRLIVCTLDVIARWDAGPTPRYLFAGLIDTVLNKEKPE